jgi:hypothetical protein
MISTAGADGGLIGGSHEDLVAAYFPFYAYMVGACQNFV